MKIFFLVAPGFICIGLCTYFWFNGGSDATVLGIMVGSALATLGAILHD